MRKILIIISIIIAILGVSFLFRNDVRLFFESMQREIAAPESVTAQSIKKIWIPAGVYPRLRSGAGMTQGGNEIMKVTTSQPKKPQLKIPERFNLEIPFTPQAPHANWNLPYQEACEEASVLMAQWFIKGEKSKTKTQADAEILQMIDWEKETFGFYEDTTIEETLRVVKEYAQLSDAFIVRNPTVAQIKEFIAQGYPVLMPASGKQLKNPNFKNGGPKFHMLVIRGYTKDTLVTNDPGTRKGKNYQYKIPVIMNAMHDWNDGDVIRGEKAVIVIKY